MNTWWLRLRSGALRLVSRILFRVIPRNDLHRLGSYYGGWFVPVSLLDRSSICYCVGVGEDITFDLALIERFGCSVFAFDPTPRAIRHASERGSGVRNFHFQDIGLWSEDATLKFYAPRNPAHVSHSVVNLQGSSEFFEARCRRLSHVMRDLGHAAIDLLKLDIEGAEYDVIRSMLADRTFPRILCIEFDQPSSYRKTITAIRALRSAGYSLCRIDRWNYTFVLGDPASPLADRYGTSCRA